jgi:hypothetical protein
MKTMLKLLVPVGFAFLAGCVVAPARGYYHPGYYYGPRIVVAAPAPVLVVRP